MRAQMTPGEATVGALLAQLGRGGRTASPVRGRRVLAVAAAACVAVALPAAVLLPRALRGTAAVAPNSTAENLGRLPSWEERTLPERYDRLEVGGRRYDSMKLKADPGQLGEFLCDAVLTGYDLTDPNFYIAPEKAKRYQIAAAVYTVRPYGREYLLAVRFEGQDDVYLYRADAGARTLGELADALNLRETLTVDSAEWTVREDGRVLTVAYDPPERSALEALLRSCRDAPYEELNALIHRVGGDFGRQLRLGCTLEAVGSGSAEPEGGEGFYFSVSERGYLFTNVFQTGAFFIGEEQADRLLRSVRARGGGTVIEERPLPPNASAPQ